MPGTSLPDVEVVLISYCSRQELVALLASWPQELAVVIVDNSPGVEPLADLLAGNPYRRLVEDGPGGFAGAANLAASTSSAEYLVFVNPDSRPPVALLGALVEDLRTGPPSAGVAPLLLEPDGRPQLGAGGWRPSVRRTVVHALGLHLARPHSGLMGRFAPGEPVAVDWVSGACLAVQRDAFHALGGFDERYFLYNEDLDYGLRASAAGTPVRLRTDLQVTHVGAGSGAPRTRSAWLRGRAQGNWVGDHLDAPSAALIRVLLVASFLARIPLYVAQGRRALAREAVAYVRGVAGARNSARTPFREASTGSTAG